MMILNCHGPVVIFIAGILVAFSLPTFAWDTDLELFDLVEEIPQSFYEFLSVEQDASPAEIKKAYRKLSLILHPDKNKAENAETQFRQLVAIYEVLKDDERRQRYNDILVNGLPDWRQPVFYYRRVRKMSDGELGLLLFLILTVGHYAVIWSIYLEKLLDEFLSKKKKEKKKKMNTKMGQDGQEKSERSYDKPHWQDILPLKVGIWLFVSIKSLPQLIQEAKLYYEDYKEMKIQRAKEEAEAVAEQEAVQREKKPKVKKPKFEFPIYEPSVADATLLQNYDQGTSIEDIEDQMDDWLDDRKSQKKKTPEWTEEDMSLLTRCMVKFPGGTPGRWEKIAHELGRSVSDVTTKVKQAKECVTNTSAGLVKLSELKGLAPKASTAIAGAVPDSLMTQREEPEAYAGAKEPEEGAASEGAPTVRRRAKKQAADGAEAKVKGRRQKDFDPTAAEEEEDEEEGRGSRMAGQQESREKSAPADVAWTQNQQKLLELALQQYPRGTAERWDRIAKVVPGKTKEECMIRYKLLAELVQKRKQAKS